MTTEISAPTSSTANPSHLPSIAVVSGLWRGITGKKLQQQYILEGFRQFCSSEHRRFALAVALLQSTRYRFRSEKLRAGFIIEMCDQLADCDDAVDVHFTSLNPPSPEALAFVRKRPNATFRDLAEFGKL